MRALFYYVAAGVLRCASASGFICSQQPTMCDGTYTGTSLNFYQQGLSGTIPTQLGQLTQATSMSVARNSMSGTIPTELGRLTRLTSQELDHNDPLSGTMPTQLGQLTQLSHIFIDNDPRLSGTVPSEYGVLTGLSYLHMGSNKLSGTLPTQLTNLVQLTQCNLSGNSFKCPLPTLASACQSGLACVAAPPPSAAASMQARSLSAIYTATGGANWNGNVGNTGWLVGDPCANQWAGVTCDSSGEVSDINLYSNGLVGTIPSEVGLLTRVQSAFSMALNQLSGTIPTEFGQMGAALERLFLFTNSISGTLPTQMGRLTALNGQFEVYNNRLSGVLPEQLVNMPVQACILTYAQCADGMGSATSSPCSSPGTGSNRNTFTCPLPALPRACSQDLFLDCPPPSAPPPTTPPPEGHTPSPMDFASPPLPAVASSAPPPSTAPTGTSPSASVPGRVTVTTATELHHALSAQSQATTVSLSPLGSPYVVDETLTVGRTVTIIADDVSGGVRGGSVVLQRGTQGELLNVEYGAIVTLRGLLLMGQGARVLRNAGTLTIDRCTITDGQADEGAGIFNLATGRLALTDSVVRGNTAFLAGGGIASEGALELSRSNVTQNSASRRGGGVFCARACTVQLIDCRLDSNVAWFGAGAFLGRGAHALINGTLIADNAYGDGSHDNALLHAHADERDAALGAGLYVGAAAQLVLSDSILRANRAPHGSGSGLYNGGSSFYVLPAPPGYYVGGAARCEPILCVDDEAAPADMGHSPLVPCETAARSCERAGLAGMLFASMPRGKHESNSLPAACASGLVIASDPQQPRTQLSHECGGACPVGAYCEGMHQHGCVSGIGLRTPVLTAGLCLAAPSHMLASQARPPARLLAACWQLLHRRRGPRLPLRYLLRGQYSNCVHRMPEWLDDA